MDNIVLGRQQFETARQGCCGKMRYDSIYPIGERANFNTFKREVLDIVREDYGTSDYFGDNDTYSIEYFEGKPGQEMRGDGKSIFLIQRNPDGSWSYYENGSFQFSVKNYEELERRWQ